MCQINHLPLRSASIKPYSSGAGPRSYDSAVSPLMMLVVAIMNLKVGLRSCKKRMAAISAKVMPPIK